MGIAALHPSYEACAEPPGRANARPMTGAEQSPLRGSSKQSPHIGSSYPAQAGIQYAAAYRFNHDCLWNTGSPAFAGDDD